MILDANRHSESSSVKMKLKEKKHFNLCLDWMGTVSEFLIFLSIIDTMYGIDSMKTVPWIMVLWSLVFQKFIQKNFRKVFALRLSEITALSCFPMNIVLNSKLPCPVRLTEISWEAVSPYVVISICTAAKDFWQLPTTMEPHLD